MHAGSLGQNILTYNRLEISAAKTAQKRGGSPCAAAPTSPQRSFAAWLEINAPQPVDEIFGLNWFQPTCYWCYVDINSFGDVLFGCLISSWTAAKFAIALCILHLEVSVVHNGWQSQSMKVVLALAIILPALAAKLPRTTRACCFWNGSHKDRPHVTGLKQNAKMIQ